MSHPKKICDIKYFKVYALMVVELFLNIAQLTHFFFLYIDIFGMPIDYETDGIPFGS